MDTHASETWNYISIEEKERIGRSSGIRRPPKLFRVILPVTDIEKAAKFYSILLNMPGKRVSSGRHYFNCGGTILACFDPKADTDNFELGPNPDHIYFAVEDLEERLEVLTHILGVIPENGIKLRPWVNARSILKILSEIKFVLLTRKQCSLADQSGNDRAPKTSVLSL